MISRRMADNYELRELEAYLQTNERTLREAIDGLRYNQDNFFPNTNPADLRNYVTILKNRESLKRAIQIKQKGNK